MLYQCSINRGVSLSLTLGAYSRYGEGVIMFSAFGYASAVKAAARELKKKCNVSLNYVQFHVLPKTMEVYCSNMAESEYAHIVAYKKDCSYVSEGKEHVKFFVFIQTEDTNSWKDIYAMALDNDYPKELLDVVYDKLYKMCPAPILKEWTPYLLEHFINNSNITEAATFSSEGVKPMKCFVVDTTVEDIVFRIKNGLSNRRISIGNGTTSPFMEEVQGIDAYLSEYSDILTRKIQNSFVPMFTPQQDQYSEDLQIVRDYVKDNDNISLYHAQTDIAQAISNAFDAGKKCGFICGECGVGKTTIAIAAVNTHFKAFKRKANRDYMTNIVMCPAHLVNTWKREIEGRSPRSQAIIVRDFSHLLSLMPLIKGKRRYNHLWLVLSKEIAKLGYERRPSVVWREHKKVPGQNRFGVFYCPKCGQPLWYETKEGRGRYRRSVRYFLTETDFRTESVKKNNIYCSNVIKVWNKTKHEYEWKTCHEPLWGPSTKETLWDGQEGHEDRWVKLGKQGWMQRQHLQKVYDSIVNQDSQTNDDMALLAAISDELKGEGYIQRAPRKYPISKFIKRYLKGTIDYAIADEAHELKGKESLQGEALGDLISTAKFNIALTGTLLNGYASGIYYLLFRLFSKHMLKEGYEYGNSQEFSKDYGVIRKSQWYEFENNRIGDVTGTTQIKELPGISPIVFTKFLLENVAFISLEDIAEALPGYEEIPIPLEMPEDLASAYMNIQNRAQELFGEKPKNSVISQTVQLLSVYPDQPYDQPSIYDPETGDILLIPEELQQTSRIKENALLSICQTKIAEGEKVLVYYSWTNRTDIKERVPAYLEEFNIKTAVLTSSVKPADREEWIQNKLDEGVQVIFCNPKLVETGLTLLDFTTIVYYQVGYNLYTMRQASRRSWRINQDHDVQVYFLYYKNTVQEQALSLMATKLQAAMAIEGKFSEEGLNAMSNNEDILTQIATSVTEGIKETVDIQVFQKNKIVSKKVLQEKQETKIAEKEKITYSFPVKSSVSFDQPSTHTRSYTNWLIAQIYCS